MLREKNKQQNSFKDLPNRKNFLLCQSGNYLSLETAAWVF